MVNMFYSDEDLLKLAVMDDFACEHFQTRVKSFYRLDNDFIFGFTKNGKEVEVNVLDEDRFYITVVNGKTFQVQEYYMNYREAVRFLLLVDML